MSQKSMKNIKLSSEDSWSGEFNKALASETVNPQQTVSNTMNIFGKNILLGFISWNIGQNISQSQMNKLIREYMFNFELTPDVLVIAFQEVPVNASIRSTRATFKEKFYKATADMLSEALKDYIIIDTYEKPSTSFFTTTSTKEKNINIFTCANIISGVGGGYGISTYIFKRKTLPISVIPIAIGERCIGSTKGYCVVTLEIAGHQKLDVINTHMPFKDEKTTRSFVSEMLRWLHSQGFQSDSQVILGDLNSRSLLTKDCYAKDITVCENEESKYCYLKEKLEELSLEDSIETSSTKSRMKIYSLTDENCDITDRVSKHRLSHDSEKHTTTIQDIIKILLKSDVLHVKMKQIFPGFKENKITFLPTYKRDEKTGKFSLSKKEKSTVYGRLPGYADRILFKGKNLKSGSNYTPLNVTGNDHLPVATIIKYRLQNINVPNSNNTDTNPNRTAATKKKTKTKKGGRSCRRRNTTTRKK